jgi:O-antigen ligase
MFILHAGSVVLFGLWAAQQVISGELRIARSPLYGPLAAFAVLVAIQLAGTTRYRSVTVDEALNYVSYGIIFFVATQSLSHRRQLVRFATVLATFGFLLAAFALIQELTSNGKLYWLRAPRVSTAMFGPYVNHSNYAGMMELLAMVPLVLAVRGRYTGSKAVLAGFAAALMGMTIFMSGSRGGMIAFFVQLLFVGLAVTLLQRRRTALFALIAVTLAVVAAVSWVGMDELLDRASFTKWRLEQEIEDKRVTITRDALVMAKDRPVLGWGAGVFPTAYPAYRSFYNIKFVNQAHNDFAQLLVETGFAGFALGLWFLVLLYRRGVAAMANGDPHSSDVVRFAALAACTGVVVHSFFDFNMHIPANAAMFFALAAIVGTSTVRQRDSRR